MSPKPGLLVLPAGLVPVGCQAVPEGLTQLWDLQEKPPPKVHHSTGLGPCTLHSALPWQPRH